METIKDTVNTLIGRKPSGPKIRYAVVAGGNISQGAFMPGVGQTSNSVMTVLVTDDPEKYDKLAKQYKLKSYKYADYNKMLDGDECDALYIATPNSMHREFTVPALEKGYHVLLEKPIEVTEEASQAILDAQRKSGAKLMIAYRLHCEPGTLNVIERVRKGDFGDPRTFVSMHTQMLKEENHRAKFGFDSGPVPDMGIYCINAVRNLYGQEPIEVSAVGFKTPGREDMMLHFDTVSVTLRFPQERVGQFTCGYSQASSSWYRLVGTKGEIEVDPGFSYGKGIAYKTTIDKKEDSKSFPTTDQFGGETEYFSDCILKNVDPEPNGEEGFLDVRVVCAIKRALETGATQKLEPKERLRRPVTAEQTKKLSMASPPKEFIGRDSDNPGK
ncbi:unnamed protein product [Didymodactylos carnosus]|uniref:Glucose-fructose oxidoreductase n=1 Tax=Didymodactylos carnosus TaxID=1234261 RepID=A0A814ABC4_9BILA|nr:unnamed protein product [Didymodactylos carnosus]CAF3692830.1 unnamed protein product [Didymodactylos carnosus]